MKKSKLKQLIKECCREILKESKDYSTPYDLANLFDVIHEVDDDVYKFIIDNMSIEERKYFAQKSKKSDMFSPDGDYKFTNTGTINMYLRGVPERLFIPVGNKMKEELEKIGVKITSDRWKTIDSSKLFNDMPVIRMDVDIPVELTLGDLKKSYHFDNADKDDSDERYSSPHRPRDDKTTEMWEEPKQEKI